MQQQLIGESNVQLGEARKALSVAEIRLEGLSRIMKLRVSAKGLLLIRREQKQTDDFASQQYARKRTELEQGDAR